MKTFYPFDRPGAVISGDLCIIKHPQLGHFCGYVAFPSDETPMDWAGNYDADALQYLAIHGGLTYARQEKDWCVFGFDCGHLDDDENPLLQQAEHVMALTEQMRDQMVAYRNRLMEWRGANRKVRAEIIDEIRSLATHKCEHGFGALIGLLSGAPEFGPTEGNAA